MQVAVFHRIGEPTPDKFTHSIEQILAFDGEITFDGVYESVFEHRIALAKHGFVTCFISGNQIGREGFCNKEQLHELYRLGIGIGWHGWSHRRLTELSDEEVKHELRLPKDLFIIDGFRYANPSYAYPHGDWDGRVAGLVEGAGFERAYSTTQGEAGNKFAIPRVYL